MSLGVVPRACNSSTARVKTGSYEFKTSLSPEGKRDSVIEHACSGLEQFGSLGRPSRLWFLSGDKLGQNEKHQELPPKELLCRDPVVKQRSTKLTEEKLTTWLSG